MNLLQSFLVLALAAGIISCNNDGAADADATDSTTVTSNTNNRLAAGIQEDPVSITADTVTLNSYVAYIAEDTAKKPIVLVVPEWWGLNNYVRTRALQLAEMGYLAVAVDMYGGGRTAANPQEAQALATPFYQNPQLAKARLDAALAKARTYPQADTSQTAAIGYCFGGSMVLNAANLGSDLDGVVSFHGGLDVAKPQKDKLKARVLVAHGGADSFVPEAQVTAFKKSMDSVGASYAFKVYPNATHAFTNPEATAKGKQFNMPISYNGAADTASWNDMKTFFGTIFTPNR
jgi:dienelactone hydrolase